MEIKNDYIYCASYRYVRKDSNVGHAVQGQAPNAAHPNQSIWLQSFKYDKEAQNIVKTSFFILYILYSLVRSLLWVNVLKVFLR